MVVEINARWIYYGILEQNSCFIFSHLSQYLFNRSETLSVDPKILLLVFLIIL